MSYQIRARKYWPANLCAQYMWGFGSILEDINVLLVAHKGAPDEQGRLTLMRYTLVAFHSFDELARKFKNGLYAGKIPDLGRGDRKRLLDSFPNYERALAPLRSDLAKVRHTLGAHRGLPSAREQKRFGKSFDAWGAWESTLVALEGRCERPRWQEALEAAFELQKTINDVNAGRWYSTEGNMFRLYTPIKEPETEVGPIKNPNRSKRPRTPKTNRPR